MGNRTLYKKSRNGKVQESAEYTYNAANQMVAARLYDGKHYKNVEYTYDADGNRIMQEEVKPDGDRKVELTYDYSVENRLKAVSDKNDLLVAMAYDGDGNRIFQLNYNLHTDDDWKGNSGNGNGNNKDNSGSGNSGNTSGNGTGSKGLFGSFFGLFGGDEEEDGNAGPATPGNATQRSNGNKDKDKGNNGNDKNNGVGNGNGNSGNNGNGNNGNGNSGNNGNGNSGPNGNTSTGGTNDNNGNANGNTNNTGGSQNQSGILFPIDGEVSELEAELIGMIKTTGKEKNYELVEYVNDVNREHTEVLLELNINGIMDTAYSYGNQRLTNERFTEWTGYYTYDPRGSVSGVTDSEGMIWQSYRYNAGGDLTFGKPQYNNVYSYNAESYNPNMESQYLRARYYNVPNGNFLTEDSYLGNITDPLTLNRYNYGKSSPLNYIDPSGHDPRDEFDSPSNYLPNESDIELLGPELYERFVYQYNSVATTTDQKWELIDQLNEVRYGGTGSKLRETVNFIMDNPQYVLGAIGAVAIYVGVTVATGGTAGIAAAPLVFSGNVLAIGGISGAVTGISYNEYERSTIRQQLKQEYGVDVENIQLYAMDKLPEKAIALCEEYDDLDKRNQMYVDTTTKLAQLALMLYVSDGVYRTGVTLAAFMANKGASASSQTSEVSQLLDKRPELTGSNRDKLLSTIQNSKLHSIANELYRPGASVGDGGTADMLRKEFYEGSSIHLQKAQNRLNELNKLANSENLGLNDWDILEALRTDLENAIKLFE